MNSLIRHYCERNDIIAPKDRRALASPSRTSPISPPTASSGRPRSFGMRDPSPVRGSDDATQSIVSITPAALQSTTEASAHRPAPSLRDPTSPAINALALSPFTLSCQALRARQRPRVGQQQRYHSGGEIHSLTLCAFVFSPVSFY